MYLKHYYIGALTLFVHLLPASAHSAACISTADSLANAKVQYMASCTLPLKDCDPVDGIWHCSSEKVSTNSIASAVQATTQITTQSSILASVPSVRVGSAPEIETGSCIDLDGDGWGWNGVRSCFMETQSSGIDLLSSELTATRQQTPGACLNPDENGWGWDGVRSCFVAVQSSSVGLQSSEPAATSQLQTAGTCLDPDGDGWGWNGLKSCKITAPTPVTPVTPVTQVTTPEVLSVTQPTAACTGTYSPFDITDLVLVTGQSNVTGAETSVSATLDRWGNVIEFHSPDAPHPRVFAWTVDAKNNNAGTGWQVAALNQSWHDGAPGIGGIARNSFALHFAKQIVQQDACSVVGFVVVSEGGKGISHWDTNATGWREVVRHVTEAISAIGRTSIDGILWHQGESDWIIDGTCFASEHCRNNQPDYYPQKLYSRIADRTIPNPVGESALVDRLRRQSWFSADKPFIAGETIKAPVNRHLNKLNTDNDSFTSCISSDLESGLGIRENDPYQNHYSASGLRELGARYATEYLRMTK